LARKSLELDEDPAFQERFWTIERWCWLGFAALVLAGLLGLFGGGGVFSRASLAMSGASLDYPAVTRWQSDDTLEVDLSGDARTVTLPRSLTEAFDIERILPRPSLETPSPLGTILTFGEHSGGHVSMAIRATKPGLVTWSIKLGTEDIPEITTMVMP